MLNTDFNQKQPSIQINEKNCVIFLFTPKKIPDQVIRPLTYNFNQALTEGIYDTIRNNKPEDFILNSPIGNTSVIPNAKGIRTNTSLLSHSWSFVMIIDQSGNDSIRQEIPNRFANMRFIYSGYCSEEPILPHTMNLTDIVINPQSKLIITRKVMINKLNYKINSFGSHTKEDVLEDILVAKYDRRLINDSLFSLFPGDVMDAVDSLDNFERTDITHPTFATINSEDSLEIKDNIKMSSTFQSPKRHLKSIIGSIKDGIEDIAMAENLGGYSDTFMGDLNDHNDYIDDVVYNNIRSNLVYNGNVNVIDTDTFGINSSDNVFLQDIKNHYDPNIYIIKNQVHEQMNIIPQNHISIESIFSSLISTCIPSYAINTKLSSVSFWYDSFRDIIEPYHFDSPTMVSQQELLGNWNAFVYLFKKELVPILRDNGGEFNVLVNCVTNGSTYVKLVFNDNGKVYGNEDYFENSAIPGGLTTNMIGTPSQLTNNGAMLYNLSNNVATTVLGNQQNDYGFVSNSQEMVKF